MRLNLVKTGVSAQTGVMGRPFIPRSDCLSCGAKVKRFGKKFCSRICAAKFRVQPILERREHRECLVCHRMFSEKPALMERGRKYCSKACHDKSQEKHHDFVCSKCKIPKTALDFYVDRTKARGHVARCKQCYSETSSKVLAFKPYRREASLQAGAVRRGLAYELTREQFMTFWQKPCTYCGDAIPTVGLDRVENDKGYTLDNLVSCCAVCNSMKSSMTMAQFLARCGRIAARTSDCNSAITHGGKY